MVGVPSHLLWWIHVLPVAVVTYRFGVRGGMAVVAFSALLVGAGERLFGAGYWTPADWATVFSLTVAVTFTNLLVAGFALYARALARRYQLLFERAQIGILRTAADGRILAANPRARRVLSPGENHLTGRLWEEIPGGDVIPPPAKLESMGGWAGSIRIGSDRVDRGGATHHLVAAAVGQDEPAGHQVLLVDRTLEAAQEAELERQGRLAMLGETLASVAHELRNPLSVILASAQLIRTEATDDPELEESAADIEEQAVRMTEISQDLLGYSRPIQAGESFRLDDLLERLVRLQRVARGRRIEWGLRVEWSGTLRSSRSRVEQILANLLVNAADAVEEGGGGRVEVRARRRAQGENGQIVVEVADDGPGVPADLKSRIFEPFPTTKEEGKGTGLGLPISRRLAQSLGGTLTAGKDQALGGALFTLTLPDSPGRMAVQSAHDGAETGGAAEVPSS